MSREVRRVPVAWQHPIVPNQHWEAQYLRRRIGGRPEPRLHDREMRFRGLLSDSISEARAQWEQGRTAWEAGTHEHLNFLLRYHDEAGYLNRDGTRSAPRPYEVLDGENVVRAFFPTSAGQIQAVHPYEDYAGSEPIPDDHMPDFPGPVEELGWCLYETVSEGTPVTPVFATAEELVEHLCTVGQDWDQVPMRRAAAESVVRTGFTAGPFFFLGGKMYDSAEDADKLDAALGGA